MKLLNVIWFYSRLIVANVSFFSWYVFHHYLSTRVFLTAVCVASFSGLLVGFQVFSWKTNLFSRTETTSSWSFPTHQPTGIFTEALYTPTQLANRQAYLTSKIQAHPTHRDLLINLWFVKSNPTNPTEQNAILSELQVLDPNHHIVQQLGELTN